MRDGAVMCRNVYHQADYNTCIVNGSFSVTPGDVLSVVVDHDSNYDSTAGETAWWGKFYG